MKNKVKPPRKVRFSKTKHKDFYPTLKNRVNQYLQTQRQNRFGGIRMLPKSIVMAGLYFLPFLLINLGVFSAPLLILLLWMIMGLGLAGMGMGVMHDANHGTFSQNKRLNQIMSLSMNMLGGNSMIWRLQHNVEHHTFTNIDGLDRDISISGILRFSPHQKLMKIHRFQYIYGWLLYTLMTFSWVTSGDFSQLKRFYTNGTIATREEYRKKLIELIGWKILYYGFTLGLPLLLTSYSPFLILGGFVLMHLISGFILSIIFQTAHVMPDSEYPLPCENGFIENDWAIHQMNTTCNYSPSSRIFSWFIGGLNYQVEHHLFANISHIHYPKIAKIVQKTAREFGIQYRCHKTYFHALIAHGKMLKQLGRA